jgi:antitoxin VapB
MGINIKNLDVEAQLRELAALTGEGLTEAVEKSVTERLQRLKAARQLVDANADSELDRLVAEINALPVLDSRDADQILYDDVGLPR